MKTLLTKKSIVILALLYVIADTANAQNTFPSTGAAGIGTITPNASSLLEINSTTKGLLIPRMTQAQRNAIVTPAAGLMIYQTNSTPGFYYYSGSAWTAVSIKGANTSLSNLKTTAIDSSLYPAVNNSISLGSSTYRWKDVNLNNLKFSNGSIQTTAFVPYSPGNGISIIQNAIVNTAPDQTVVLNNGAGIAVTGTYPNFTIDNTIPKGWSLTGNSGTNPTTNFLGTTDAQPMVFKVNNVKAGYIDNSTNGNVALGYQSLLANTTGFYNSAFGYGSLKANTTGGRNTAIGLYSLFSNNADNNTAIGTYALEANTTGIGNVATGYNALSSNVGGNYNSAYGTNSLGTNTSGIENTAAGYEALYSNKTGNDNAAFGKYSLYNNNGSYNTALGYNAMFSNTTGANNTATGRTALQNNVNGNENTATGGSALYANNSGTDNTATGFAALNANYSGVNNSAHGAYALYQNTTGQQNTATGYASLYSNVNGNYNSANGNAALNSNISGNWNTASGAYALYKNTSGEYNTATGGYALYLNTTGGGNTANGYSALYTNSTGIYNTAMGNYALSTNSTGNNNVASGYQSLYHNTTGSDNVASGFEAMWANTTGNLNTAIGEYALYANKTGSYNTAIGENALAYNINGQINTAIGLDALKNNNASSNTGIGYQALMNDQSGGSNTAIGTLTLVYTNGGHNNSAIGTGAMAINITGSNNVAIGTNALCEGTNLSNNVSIGEGSAEHLRLGDNNTLIGFEADVSDTNTSYSTALGASAVVNATSKVRIGGPFITVIEGQVPFTTPSDGRFKYNITNDVKGLEFINKLRPVIYNCDTKKFDDFLTKNMPDSVRQKHLRAKSEEINKSSSVRQSGFIAQEVEIAMKETDYDFNGLHKPMNDNDNYGLAYSQFVVPLVKAVQELSAKNDSLQNTNNAQQQQLNKFASLLANLQQQINDLKIQQQACCNKATTSIAEKLNTNSIVLTDAASLEQNKPNPFSHNTTIGYSLPSKFADAQIVITDKNGKTIKAVNVSGSGKGNLNVDASTLASGAYQYSLMIDGRLVATKQMVLTK